MAAGGSVAHTGLTRTLADFLATTRLDDIPDEVVDRTLHLALDGVVCALVGAHLPWSELAVDAIRKLEGSGNATVVGWDIGLPPTAAALLNSTFIQGFELDDVHELGGMHVESLAIPPALAAAETVGSVTGETFLLALALGFEAGPRFGVAANSYDLIRRGWHSGAVEGGIPAAAAAGVVYGLDGEGMEDALGIAATQASGIMSVQFESMVKRMNHGFNARNGLVAAALAAERFTGMKGGFEREFGGWFATFGAGGRGVDPAKLVDRLGKDWELTRIVVKPFSSGGTTHPTADAFISIRNDRGIRAEDIAEITIRLPEGPFKHNGWKLERPLTPIAAQLNVAYVAAVALLDGEVFVEQFSPTRLDSAEVWDLIDRTTVLWDPDLDELARESSTPRLTRISVSLKNGDVLDMEIREPKGWRSKLLTNDEILRKARALCKSVMSDEHAAEIEEHVLTLRKAPDIGGLVRALRRPVTSPFA